MHEQLWTTDVEDSGDEEGVDDDDDDGVLLSGN
jgi:hypothetical protein